MTSREPAGAGLRGNPEPRTTPDPAAGSPWTSRAYRLRWGAGLATAAALVALAPAPWGAGASSRPSPAGATNPAGAVDPVGPGQVSDPSYGPPPASGTGRDPLTPTELDRARSLGGNGGPLAGAEDVAGGVGGEQLSVELVARRPDGHRRAALFTYDYRADRLVKQVVDLTAGRLEGSYAAAEMQPPAVPREVRVALDLLLADPLGDRLRTRYRELAGRPLTEPAQLVATAQTYLAPAAGGPAANCGRHRCVQLITQLPDGPFVDVTDLVVDLSGRTVVRLS
ncbi:hypothetical protein V6V47_31485 [Micromonospora sp. CPCC 205539]|uniref:hypothetical protein n=1 Tax=Micromonospora sp. CPCC 205539 TaxID=3122408 RepID=UPI002FF329F2